MVPMVPVSNSRPVFEAAFEIKRGKMVPMVPGSVPTCLIRARPVQCAHRQCRVNME